MYQKERKQPLVSILLSIYSVEEYLEECLDSLLNQSYQNLEIVCVDNGSPDNCGKILEKYANKDPRIKVITLKENRMLCGGRNVGLDNATGEFLCFVDPDDWVEKDHIKAMVDAIETKKDSHGKPYNLVINYNAVSYMKMPNNKDKILYNFSSPKTGEITFQEVNKEASLDTRIPMWGRLYRKSFLDKHKDVRFIEGLNIDNIPYTLKLLAHMKCFYIIQGQPNATYWRRLITPQGAITPRILWKSLEIVDSLENLFDYLKEHHLEKEVRIIFYSFFTLCFPKHADMPRYYLRLKALMQKMEDTIKSSDIYLPEDINLCNLLLYTNGYFEFCDRYFAQKYRFPYIYKIKLFGFIPFLYVRSDNHSTYYDLFKIPLLKKVQEYEKTVLYLFNTIILWSKKNYY